MGRAEAHNVKGDRHSTRSRVVSAYDYRDEGGQLLYQSVRMDPKTFRQRRPNGKGGWIWNVKGVRLVLYRLTELLKRETETVFICEGEKMFTPLKD